ncbi:hypothetical protein PM082_022861 [Marasmius tenuissimus]|nr:hypothetical protein PM082_022861 [Marasmius tenuissimus]
MSFYSFQTESASKKARVSLPITPIPADQFYGTPSSRHNAAYPPTPASSRTPINMFTSTPSQNNPASTARKRRHPDQNDSGFINCTPTKPPHPRKKNKKEHEKPPPSPREIVVMVIKFIQTFRWGLSDFLFWVSQWEDRDIVHASAMEKFLSGRCTHHPGEVIRMWYKSPDGVLGSNVEDGDKMWGMETRYWEVKQVRACLTSFAAQECVAHAVLQARRAVRPEGGLHIRLTVKDDTGAQKNLVKKEWKDIGATTVPRIKEILNRTQPFLFHLLSCVARGSITVSDGIGPEIPRKTRPVDTVVTHAISSLNFSLNRRANWLPVARGLLYFSLSAPVDLFAYESRTGTMPVYQTVNSLLADLGEEEGRVTAEAGSDPRRWVKIFIDNTQRNHHQRDERVGRADHMMIGMAGCLVEYPPGSFPIAAPSIDDRRTRIQANQRSQLNVDFFLNLIDHDHLELVGTFQWMLNFTTFIPQLRSYNSRVTSLYETRAARIRLDPKPSVIHPLATNGKNETVTPELKDALLDFMRQAGQTPENHQHRLFPVGGDGLTYQKINELKRYLQLYPDELEGLGIVEPQLEWWHTQATDVTRIFQTHCGPPLSRDPSTLGHSARKIKRKEPANLKKVDYHPSVQLMHLVLDARMLDALRSYLQVDDIFEHFEKLDCDGKLPSFEKLEEIACTLYQCYSTSRGIHHALHDSSLPSESSPWAASVPTSVAWATSEQDLTNGRQPAAETREERVKDPKKSNKKKKKTKAEMEAEREREESRKSGDRVLANSIAFIRDALLSREAAYAAAAGDVGRFWEVFKVMLFMFFGSGHAKYGTYALEFITTLELESSKELREASLRMMLINLSGKPGAFAPCDLIQEYFNRLLEFIVERKGKEFGDHFIRRVVARNLHHLTRIKTDLRAGVNLAKHSGKHSEPGCTPEMKILLDTYKLHQLHFRIAGRIVDMDEREIDNFYAGWLKMGGPSGKVQKWADETTRSRIKEDIERRIAALTATSSTTTTCTSGPMEATGNQGQRTPDNLAGASEDSDDESTSNISEEESQIDSDSDEDDEERAFDTSTLASNELRDGWLVTTTFTAESYLESMEVEDDLSDLESVAELEMDGEEDI